MTYVIVSTTVRGVDALAGLVDGVRARGAFVLRLSLQPPWSIRVEDRALTLVCQLNGSATINTPSGVPVRIDPGDIALARGTENYVYADTLGSPPQVVIHPGQRCTTTDGRDLRFDMAIGVRSWGNSASGPDRAVIGAYDGRSHVGSRLLDALPAVLVLKAGELDTPLVALLADEAAHDSVGQSVYLDRLLDLLLIAVLRTWLSHSPEAPGWWYAEADRIVGPALRLMFNNPEKPWTVAALAASVDTSRATFARRFTELVGEPPMAFLTDWRLSLAAELLESGEHTLSAVARQVGYTSPFAFSTAFKRVRGVSPAQFRATAQDAAPDSDISAAPSSGSP